jgi:hypothetical protein
VKLEVHLEWLGGLEASVWGQVALLHGIGGLVHGARALLGGFEALWRRLGVLRGPCGGLSVSLL